MPGIKLNLSEEEKRVRLENKISKKLQFLKKDFIDNKITNFGQIEAFLPTTILANKLHIQKMPFL